MQDHNDKHVSFTKPMVEKPSHFANRVGPRPKSVGAHENGHDLYVLAKFWTTAKFGGDVIGFLS